ncbi:9732_t:CDS:2 [Cetraspora pellucida]|uniref:9732_t:CDS:1 n=1 Tax=Cetraspora pellucida TaxID=1433469 RepID=A0ACA9KII4_9GLOM|nr:9732_t:CDS:2 [Cetraspora pellucida]
MARSQESDSSERTEISRNNIDDRSKYAYTISFHSWTSNNISVARKQRRAEAERNLNLKIRNGFDALYNVLPRHLASNKMSKADLLQKGGSSLYFSDNTCNSIIY